MCLHWAGQPACRNQVFSGTSVRELLKEAHGAAWNRAWRSVLKRLSMRTRPRGKVSYDGLKKTRCKQDTIDLISPWLDVGERSRLVEPGGRWKWLDLATDTSKLCAATWSSHTKSLRPRCFRSPPDFRKERLPQREPRANTRKLRRAAEMQLMTEPQRAAARLRGARWQTEQDDGRQGDAAVVLQVMARRKARKAHIAARLIQWTWRRRHLLPHKGVRWPILWPIPRCLWGSNLATEAEFKYQFAIAQEMIAFWKLYVHI